MGHDLYEVTRKLNNAILTAYGIVFGRQGNHDLGNAVNKVSFMTDVSAHGGGVIVFALRTNDGDVYLGRSDKGHNVTALADCIETALRAFADAQNDAAKGETGLPLKSTTSVHA